LFQTEEVKNIGKKVFISGISFFIIKNELLNEITDYKLRKKNDQDAKRKHDISVTIS